MYRSITSLCAAVLFALVTGLYAQDPANAPPAGGSGAEASDAAARVRDATEVIERAKHDPRFRDLLAAAHGVFIVPHYGRVAALVGGRGGRGVVTLREDRGVAGEWTPPAFFHIGGVSVGAAAGIETGALVMLLMSDRTVEMFLNDATKFALDSTAGLTIGDYSVMARGSSGRGDVAVWTDVEGAFAGGAVGISDIARDEKVTAAYYGNGGSTQAVLAGKVESSLGRPLRDELSGSRAPEG